ncbi:MAG: hypothetical protein KAJ91_03110 [Candidatus Aenigmarchaeota archaeon]|nr:hypothetical protein [Candidatus Aenigmarchaeota archaeon]
MEKQKKVYNIALSKDYRREYFTIDRDTKIARVYYIILNTHLKKTNKTEHCSAWDVAKEYFSLIETDVLGTQRKRYRRINSSDAAQIWRYVRLLEKQGFISVEDIKGSKRKKKRLVITKKIYFSLLCHFWSEYAQAWIVNNHITKDLEPNALACFEKIPLNNLFLKQDCETFIHEKINKKTVSPLSSASKRISMLCRFIRDHQFIEYMNLSNPESNETNDAKMKEWAQVIFGSKSSPFVSFMLLSQFHFSLDYMSPEAIDNAKKELKEVGLWNDTQKKEVEKKEKEYLRNRLETVIKPSFEHVISFFGELKKIADKGLYVEEYELILDELGDLPKVDNKTNAQKALEEIKTTWAGFKKIKVV